MRSVKTQKTFIRKQLLSYRANMPEPEYINYSAMITDAVQTLDEFQQAKTIHIYQSINQRQEPDTRLLTQIALEAGKKVAVPIINMEKGCLRHVWIDADTEMVAGNWDVPEPKDGEPADLKAFDVIIVPMVGADERRNRMGYGKGFYDKFLSESGAFTIGLVFGCCIYPALPVEEHDVRLSKIVTEKRIF